MEKQQPPTKFKILMLPWLAHGHIFPFVELAKRLPTTKFTIYLCSTSINLDSIRPNINDDGSVKLLQLQMPSLPELPPELHTTKNLPPNLIPTLRKTFQMTKPSFSDILDSVKPDLLIYDLFQPWAPKLASSRGIPSVYFSVVGTISFCYYHHLHTMGTGSSSFPYKAVSCLVDEETSKVPDLISLHVEDADEGSFAFGTLTLSDEIVLVKSCREVEAKFMDYLSVLCNRKIVPTGPLFAYSNGNSDDWESSDILRWLSTKDEASTIYISFGSEFFLSKEKIAEIAKGLLLSSANFLWVLRFPSGAEKVSVEEELPQGFLETVKDRGMVVQKWAPQAKILGHPSIVGFVSHCGWGSLMESAYFGVPIIGIPMNYEQPVNAGVVVEAGFGVVVEKDENIGFYAGEELAKAINKVTVDEPFSQYFRKRAKILSEKIREKEDEEVNEAVEQLVRLCLKNKKQD